MRRTDWLARSSGLIEESSALYIKLAHQLLRAPGNVLADPTVHGLAELLGSVVLVQEVVSDFLEVGQVRMEESTSNGKEVRMSRILDFNHTPRILPGSHTTVVDLHDIFRANNREGHQPSQLRVLFHRVFVILLNVVGKVVDGYSVVLNVFHHELLRLGKLSRCERVSLANNGDDVDSGRKTLHELDVKFTETVASWCNEVEKGMYAIVAEARIALDPGFFGKNGIVLSFEIAHDLTKGRFVVDLITEAGCVDDGERNSGTLLVNLEFCSLLATAMCTVACAALTNCDGFDSDTFLQVGAVRIVGVFRLKNFLPTEGVDKCRST